jgi:TatD DNase family protein
LRACNPFCCNPLPLSLAAGCNAETIPTLRALAAQPQVLAVGETGLDYDRNFSTPDVQCEWFQKQV